jgi:hypothetical protein
MLGLTISFFGATAIGTIARENGIVNQMLSAKMEANTCASCCKRVENEKNEYKYAFHP